MNESLLSSREYEFTKHSIEPLVIYEDPSGSLQGGVGATVWDAGIVLAKYLERVVTTELDGHTPAQGNKIELVPGLMAQPGQPVRILELGAGTGIVALALARLLQDRESSLPSDSVVPETHVVMTDKANVLPILQKNLDSNTLRSDQPSKIHVEAYVLDWEHYSGVRAQEEKTTMEEQQGDSATRTITTTTSKDDKEGVKPNTTENDFVDQGHLDQVHWDLIIVSDCIWITSLHAPLNATLAKLVPKEQQHSSQKKTKILTAFERRDFAKEMEFFAQLGKEFRFRDVKPEEMDPDWQSEDIYIFIAERRDVE